MARSLRQRVNITKVLWILVGLAVFIFALQLAKGGADSAAPFVRDTLDVSNPANAIGLGWIFAYIVLSGSPVAAAALALLSSGTITEIETFAMITGSRLGASFVVLLLGGLYVLRGHERRAGLAIGLTALIVTASLQIPSLAIGYFVLKLDWLAGFQFEFSVFNILNTAYEPLVNPIVDVLPGFAVFALGVVLIVGAFNMIDRGLPEIDLEERGIDNVSRLLYRPEVMFAIGLAVTLVSLSVSVSLGILVPLSARGLIRRENLIPYIMGCNISTFIDTLVVAALLQSAQGFTIVLVAMLSVAVVSAVILALVFDAYERGIVWVVDWTLDRNRNFAIFLAAFFLVPLALMVF